MLYGIFNRNREGISNLVVLFFLLFNASVALSQYKIMPLGNSITVGKGDPNSTPYVGYRYDLYHLLINDGWNFDFVGSQSDGNPNQFDPDHEGHSGWKAQDIDANINSWLNQSDPNIVLLHIGTNDVSSMEPNSETIAEIESIVNKIYTYNSSIAILLCKLVPRKEQPDNEHIINEELNNLIQQLYTTKKNDERYNIYLVDQFAAFKANDNWRTDYMVDNVHPSSAGYTVMANTFFNVLQGIGFPQFTLTVLVNPDGAGTVSVDPDKRKYIYQEQVTLTAIPSGNNQFSHWSGDIDVNSANPRSITMMRDRTIVANFINDDDEFVSVPNTPTGPSSGNTGEELSFLSGGSTSSKGNPVEYQFDWGDGGFSQWGASSRKYSYGGAGTYQVRARARSTVNNDAISSWSDPKSVTITGESAFVLTVWINPEGAGTVQVDPQKDSYDSGERVKLQAFPNNPGDEFLYWSGDITTNYNNPIYIYM
ncbi:MAG TPA: hypothetical protein ENN22_12120, partial [bacterium]|nr:hypothetical protein [bacterium]